METYANNNGNSSVVAYRTGTDYIIVQFSSGSATFYKYTHSSAGQAAVGEMKRLAVQGSGLNSYISTTKPSYESKGSSLEAL
jgi:hypothetical protein